MQLVDGPYLEMFARPPHPPGWDVWGDEVEQGAVTTPRRISDSRPGDSSRCHGAGALLPKSLAKAARCLWR